MVSVRALVQSAALCSTLGLCLHAGAQQEKHGRGYKPPPATAEVVITVEKGFNGKPLPNASVVFRSSRNDQVNGVLEMKTDTEGRAKLDLLEVGSHVVVQVLANGFATYASDFDLTNDGKEVLVKLERPHSQVTMYGDVPNQPKIVQPGVQEHVAAPPAAGTTAPTSVPPAASSPTGPLKTTPPANTPATSSPTTTPNTPGTPQ